MSGLPLMLYILFIILLLPFDLFAQDVDNILGNLSKHDRQSLEKLFHILLDEDQFCYTLFGDKPVSLSGDYVITPYQETLSGRPSGDIFWRKWAIWKKFQENLSITKYIFIEEPAYNCPDGTIGFIFFVNKQAFLDTVDQHIQTFRGILGQEITATKLLAEIERKHAFMATLKGSELLLGILLGYGENNARLFARRVQLRKFISAQTSLSWPEKRPLPAQGFSSIEEEEKFLGQQLQPFSSHDGGVPWRISSVQFAADPHHSETKLLKDKYSHWRGEIARRYAENNKFLELIISQLTAG